MINRVCKRCGIALDISNSVKWGEINFRFCKDCVEATQDAERAKPTFPIDAISDLGFSFHEFFIEKFLGHLKPSLQPFRYLKMVEIIEYSYFLSLIELRLYIN